MDLVTTPFAFEPIEVQTRSAPQNDHLNLSFVKDIYVYGKNLLEMVVNFAYQFLYVCESDLTWIPIHYSL